jgi:hypothetical protein
MGRDIGLFGKDAILDDMTLLGVGSVGNNAAPGNTSLGRIGIGYIYTDWEPQITYTTPNFNGFSFSAGIFQPLDAVGLASFTRHGQPQVQAGVSYAWGDAKNDTFTGKVCPRRARPLRRCVLRSAPPMRPAPRRVSPAAVSMGASSSMPPGSKACCMAIPAPGSARPACSSCRPRI